MARVLVVEDDTHIRDLIVLHLGLEGLETEAVGDGMQGLALASAHAFDLILLDLMLPGMDGVSICRSIRREGPNQDVPLLMLTARREESDKVLGLESGADDYLVKPFGFRELLARIRAVSRRTSTREAGRDPETLVAGALEIDLRSRRALLAGNELPLTPKEFELLALLARDPGTVVDRQRILREVWNTTWYGGAKTIDVHVGALRRKLGDPAWIETVRGVGLRLEPPA